MNAGDMEKLAKAVVKETVKETFLTLGLNIDDPISVQNQFAFLRNLHYSMRHVRNTIIAGVLGMLVTGAGWAFWAGFKARAAAPPAVSARP